MSISRRIKCSTAALLRSSVAAGLGLFAADFDHALARPHSRLHPISPERVVILGDGGTFSGEKAHWIDRLAKVLSDHYAIPSTGWANGIAWREALGSTAMGHGFGLLHQFQDSQQIRLETPPVDWWLFLFPNGIAWNSFDDEPVFGMIGHIFSPGHLNEPALKLKVYELTSRIGYDVMRSDGWRAIARLDGAEAARQVNLAVARCMGE